MTQTLKQIINSAQAELGLPQAATVVGNSDATTTQMLALSQRVLDEIRRRNRWVNMQFEFNLVVNPPIDDLGTISAGSLNVVTGLQTATVTALTSQPYAWAIAANSVPAAARVTAILSPTSIEMDMEATGPSTNQSIQFGQDTYAMPAGLDWMNNRTMWDRTNRWELLGPDSPQMDQWHRSGIVAIGPRRHFRQIGPYANQFRLWPAPFEIVNPLQLVFEYLSIDAVYVNGSPTQFAQYFENDDDQPILDDQSVIMGIKWMFWQTKGFNYADMKNDWIDYVDRQSARDGAASTLSLNKRPRSILINSAQVQDGYFPGPIGSNSI